MLIDCETCVARDAVPSACPECVVTVLLRTCPPVDAAPGAGWETASLIPGPSGPLDLDAAERAAIETLAEAGLVPPLRLVPTWRGIA